MKSKRLYLFLGLAMILQACASKPVVQSGFQKAQWETKAMIRDLRQNKTQNLDIDIFAIKNDRARFEVTALLGFQVASLVMSASEIACAIYPEKKFYYGKNSEQALARLLNLPLHPMNLTYIAFDEPVRGPGWSCQKDSTTGLIANCTNMSRNITVEWKERNQGEKKVVIRAPQFEMQWHFNAPQTEVQFKSDLFTLKQPEGFKAIQVN